MNLERLPTWTSKKGVFHVVVEAPRGCGLKLKYDAALEAFLHGVPLPAGLSYPYDWGFVPGTRGEDGDPLDALVITDVPSYPGVVIECVAVAMLELDQLEGKKRVRNDRVVAIPAAARRHAELSRQHGLTARLRVELEKFFLDTTFFSSKNARVLGWRGPAAAAQRVKASQRGADPAAPPSR